MQPAFHLATFVINLFISFTPGIPRKGGGQLGVVKGCVTWGKEADD